MKEKKEKNFFKKLLLLFLTWRLILIVISLLSIKILPFKESFPYINSHLKQFGSPLFWSQANFDGVHYLRIAQEGYQARFTQAFFPFYPILINLLNKVVKNYLLSGLLISNLSFFLSLFFFYQLSTSFLSEKSAQKSLLVLLFFPTSFFFVSFYSESLFFLFVILSFYLFNIKRTAFSALSANLASATRFIGLFIFPALIFKLVKDKGKKYLLFLFIPVGLLLYMTFLWIKFKNPFLFFSSLSLWEKSTITFPLITVGRYLKMLLFLPKNNWQYFTILLELFIFLLFSITAILAFFKTPFHLALFNFLTFSSFIFLGTFSSLPRYVLVLFPSFFVLSQIKKKLFYPLITLFAILQALSYVLFFRGYFIA